MKRMGGFTIVELLVVIVVIAVLAAVTLVSYNGIRDRAYSTKITSDLHTLDKAVQTARLFASKPLKDITGSTYTASACRSKPSSVDLATLSKSDACWTRYQQTLDAISDASGMSVSGLVDPWGRPYDIDENEGENDRCIKDSIGAYVHPRSGSSLSTRIWVPFSGFSAYDCS